LFRDVGNAFPFNREVMTAKYVDPVVILQSLHRSSQSVSNLRYSSGVPLRDELDVRWTVAVRRVRLDFEFVIIGSLGFLLFDLEGDGWNDPSLPFVSALLWFRE